MFLNKEMRDYAILLESILLQLESVLLGLEGSASFTPSIHEVANVLSKGLVPQSWCRYSKVTLRLTKWISSLKQHIQAINKYRQCEANDPLTLDISVFQNKSSLFHALISDWSRTNGMVAHNVEITFEVCMNLDF